MTVEKALETAFARAASAGLGEFSRFLNPDQEAVSTAQFHESRRTFSRAALRHSQTMVLFLDSVKQIPELYDAFAAALADRGVSVIELEKTARDGIVQFQLED